MRIRKINRCLSFFILFIFCITGIYQSYDLADSFFVCENENNAVIYETSFVDHTQDAFLENTDSLSQLSYNRKESDLETNDINTISNYYNDIFSKEYAGYSGSIFSGIIQESCLNHFCRSVITNYIHLKDGQK